MSTLGSSVLLLLALATLCRIAGALPQASLAELPKAVAGSTLQDVENHLESLRGIAARQTLRASSQHSGPSKAVVRSALGRQLVQSRADGEHELPDFKQDSSPTADGALHHTPDEAREYVACINAHQPGLNITTWSEAMEGEPLRRSEAASRCACTVRPRVWHACFMTSMH